MVAAAPFRHLVTPGGFRMSVAMTNCGALGWVTDRTGYRYDAVDPDSGRAWPPLPAALQASPAPQPQPRASPGSSPTRASSIATSPAPG